MLGPCNLRKTSLLLCASLFLIPRSSGEFICPSEDITYTHCEGAKDCLYPNLGSCDTFIHCEMNPDGRTGHPTVVDCPSGLEWNDNKKACDYPEQSTCQNLEQEIEDTAETILPPPGGKLTQAYSCSNCTALGLGVGADCVYPTVADDNSADYVQCIDGLAYLVACATGLSFKEEIGACD